MILSIILCCIMKQFVVVLWCYFYVVVNALDLLSVCITPNGETASCISLFNCPTLVRASASDDPIVIKFIQESACGSEKFMICCGTAGSYIKDQNKTELFVDKEKEKEILEKRKFALEKLLPSRVYCGLQHTDDYLYTKNETSVDEFPWMVYIPSKTYIHDHYLRIEANCVGVLISNRYFLTHKDCDFPNVVIGQHHIYKDVSCIDTPYDIKDCTSPLLLEFVERYVFAQQKVQQELYVLNYIDYIRPICLPMERDKDPQEGEVALTSGWGEEQRTQGRNVKLKKRIKHTILNKEECKNGNPIANPICGERFANSTSYVCPGDKGGGLMYRYSKSKNLNWVILGIIVENTTCVKHRPVVAERITSKRVNWILDNMEP